MEANSNCSAPHTPLPALQCTWYSRLLALDFASANLRCSSAGLLVVTGAQWICMYSVSYKHQGYLSLLV